MLSLIIMTLFIQSSLYSQFLLQKKADKLYNDMEYASAMEYYKDLIRKDFSNESNMKKLADCYFRISDFSSAEQCYFLLNENKSESLSENELLNYFQVLKYNKNYSSANKVLDLMESKGICALIVKNHRANTNYLFELKKDSAYCSIINLEDLNTEYSEFSPVQTEDGKQIVFSSNRKNTFIRNKTSGWDNSYFIDVYTSTKKDSIHFENPKKINKEVISDYHDGPISFSPDENTIYLTRSNFIKRNSKKRTLNVVNLKLCVIYKGKDGKYSIIENFPYNSENYSLGHATLTSDGKRLYFVSDMPGGYGQTDIYYSDNNNGAWSKPVNLGPNINTEGRELFPYISDEGILYFSSDGRAGLGGLDIYYTDHTQNMSSEPENLGYPLNSTYDDFGLTLNTNHKSGYISSNRIGGKGKDDIYYFVFNKPVSKCTLKGVVLDISTKNVISGIKVLLMDGSMKVIDSAYTDNQGSYQLKIMSPSKNYNLSIKESENYVESTLTLKDIQSDEENYRNIELYPKYSIKFIVSDFETNNPIDSVNLSIIDKISNQNLNYFTNAQGVLSIELKNKKSGDEIDLLVKFEKKGFLTEENDFKAKLSTSTLLEFNEKLSTNMKDLERAAELNPIYFDLGVWEIRPDAAKELDKIVKIMLDNPEIVIELSSHTDCRSSRNYNMILSEKRAKASAAYLVSKGIQKSRIVGKGYGESKLINHCECEDQTIMPCSEENHQVNRRTEFKVLRLK